MGYIMTQPKPETQSQSAPFGQDNSRYPILYKSYKNMSFYVPNIGMGPPGLMSVSDRNTQDGAAT